MKKKPDKRDNTHIVQITRQVPFHIKLRDDIQPLFSMLTVGANRTEEFDRASIPHTMKKEIHIQLACKIKHKGRS